MDNYFLELKRGSPIQYGNLMFYPISLKEICDTLGYEAFNQYMLPFCISRDYIESLKIEDLKEDYDMFEDVIMEDSQLLFYMSQILTLFCKIYSVYKNDKQLELCNEDDTIVAEINKDNFDDICEILNLINNKAKIKVELPPKDMSERQRDVWEKLQAGRKRNAEKNETHIYDVLNFCEYAGDYRVPIGELETWTLWRIFNCYNSKVSQMIYRDDLLIGLVAHDLKNINGDKHWSKQLMIRK